MRAGIATGLVFVVIGIAAILAACLVQAQLPMLPPESTAEAAKTMSYQAIGFASTGMAVLGTIIGALGYVIISRARRTSE